MQMPGGAAGPFSYQPPLQAPVQMAVRQFKDAAAVQGRITELQLLQKEYTEVDGGSFDLEECMKLMSIGSCPEYLESLSRWESVMWWFPKTFKKDLKKSFTKDRNPLKKALKKDRNPFNYL